MTYQLHVAVPRPFYTLLTYAAETQITNGCRITIPLANTRITGLVVKTAPRSDTHEETFTIRNVQRQIDQQPLLDQHLLDFLHWACTYYQHPPGEVYFAALPAALRGEKQIPQVIYWETLPAENWQVKLQRAHRQQALYHWLKQHKQPVPLSQIRQAFGNGSQSYLNGLFAKGLATSTPFEKSMAAPPKIGASPLAETVAPQNKMELTEQQTQCLQDCLSWSVEEKLRPILLHGVTGSGKTEIYLRLIHELLHQQGKQALVLVPEIGLTPQLIQRFRQFFPQRHIIALHSALNDTERLDAWLQARNSQAKIIIGTRSAVFTPCPNLGLIIVDEEHDLSFKQQEGFRYHGRDLAIKRAQMLAIPVILGSATPALESLHNADQQRYHYTRLDKRPGTTRPPTLKVQDTRGIQLQAGLSKQSLAEMRTTLDRREQVMVFINRRGFAPVLLCAACGWQAQCTSCSSNMTYHARVSRLICHHCGTDQLANNCCPDCGNQQLITQGQGTERIELMLQQLFDDTEVIRIDRDSTRRKGTLQQQLDKIHRSDQLILVGTQMLAKGHDFPNLTLVVILDIDQALLSSEYHALERFGQLLTQVAGRAGRRSKPGQVILQTTQPTHPVLSTLLQQGYPAFARQLLEERRRWHYPPFGYQALIRATAKELDAALDTLAEIRSLLLEQALLTGVTVLGPIPAPMEKRAGKYRAQLLLQSNERKNRHLLLKQLTQHERNVSNKRGVRWSIDVDPVELS